MYDLSVRLLGKAAGYQRNGIVTCDTLFGPLGLKNEPAIDL